MNDKTGNIESNDKSKSPYTGPKSTPAAHAAGKDPTPTSGTAAQVDKQSQGKDASQRNPAERK